MGDWTGTVPTFPVGNLRSADMTTLADIDTALVTAWTTWSPTLTNLTLGSGTLIAKYLRTGKTIDFNWKFTYGAASAVGTNPQFTLPFACSADYSTAAGDEIGHVSMLDSGTTNRQGYLFPVTAANAGMLFWNATPALATITATTPWTWAAGDNLHAYGTYYTD